MFSLHLTRESKSGTCLTWHRVWRRVACTVIGFLVVTGYALAAPTNHTGDMNVATGLTHVSGDNTNAADIVFNALSTLGSLYKRGGDHPDAGFDCSGLVRWVFRTAIGRELPRTSFQMSHQGASIDPTQLRPGDLVFYNTLRRAFSHVGIYIGEGRFIHAPSRGRKVEIVEMREPYWQKRFNGARRVLSNEDNAPPGVVPATSTTGDAADETTIPAITR